MSLSGVSTLRQPLCSTLYVVFVNRFKFQNAVGLLMPKFCKRSHEFLDYCIKLCRPCRSDSIHYLERVLYDMLYFDLFIVLLVLNFLWSKVNFIRFAS